METNDLFVKELSLTEIKEVNGGSWPMLIIKAFVPTFETILGFFEGFRKGYESATKE